MICDRCNKNPANINIVISQANENKTINICPTCYKEVLAENFSDNTNEMGLGFFSNILSELLTYVMDDAVENEEPSFEDLETCNSCGKSLYDIKTKGKFGCANCYRQFNETAREILRVTQDSTEHIGTSPPSFNEIKELKVKLQDKRIDLESHISKEEYEDAAVVKKEIDDLNEELRVLIGDYNG